MKEVVRAIENVGLNQSLVLVVFVLFFVTMFCWAAFMRKSLVEHMRALPLEDDHPVQSPNTGAPDHE